MLVKSGAIIVEAQTSKSAASLPGEKLNLPIIGRIKVKSPIGKSKTYEADVIGHPNGFYIINEWYRKDDEVPEVVPEVLVVEFTKSNEVDAGKLSNLFGTAALTLLSMIGSISGAQKDSDKYLDIKSQLIEMQEAKSQEVLDVVYYDLVKDLGKISGSDRNKLVKQAEKVHKEMVKQFK
jgi:hypothetical protein